MGGRGTGGACAGVQRGARTRDEDRAVGKRHGTPGRRVRRPAHEHRRFGSGAPAVSWPSMHVLSASRAPGEAEETNSQPVMYERGMGNGALLTLCEQLSPTTADGM